MFSTSTYRRCFTVVSLVALFVIIVCSLTPLPALPQQAGSDKLHHFLGYGFLTFFFMQWIHATKYRMIAAIGCVLVGVIIECIQPMTNRYFEYADMLANTFGIIVGFISGILFHFVIYRRLTPSSTDRTVCLTSRFFS